MSKRTRQSFSPEFKREAVKRLQQGDIEGAQLETHGDGAFPGQGVRTRKTDDSAALRAEVKRLREENEILKKAAIFFAKESG